VSLFQRPNDPVELFHIIIAFRQLKLILFQNIFFFFNLNTVSGSSSAGPGEDLINRTSGRQEVTY